MSDGYTHDLRQHPITFTGGWVALHKEALCSGVKEEMRITGLCKAVYYYVWSCEVVEGVPWRDYVLGESVGAMLQGILGLLNGDIGRLDGGTVDSWCRHVADQIGFDLDLDKMRDG